jgi:hypothetical protein
MPEQMASKRTWITPQAQQTRVKIITIAIVIGACLGPAAFLLTVVRGTPTPPVIPPTPSYAAQATAVVTSWIEGRPAPIPTAPTIPTKLGRDNTATAARLPITNLSWSSFEREAGFSDPNYFVEIHAFTAVMNRQLVIIEVAIATQGDGPVLVALPSIIPSSFLPGPQEIPFSLEPYGAPAQLTDGARSQIREWAKAYGTNNSEALFRLTGDPEENLYQGIPNGNYILTEEPDIVGSVNPFGTDNQPQTGTIIARISLSYAQPYTQQEIDEARAAGNNSGQLTTETPNPAKSITLEFDLLLTETDRTLPFVAAWGTPGTGPTLEPYDNAVRFAPDTSTTTTTTRPGGSTSTTSGGNSGGGSTTTTSRPNTPPTVNTNTDTGEG